MPPGSSSTYDRATEWANGPAGTRAGSATSRTTWSTRSTRICARSASASGRGIGGYSSGADAALNAILLRPHLYSVAEGWSGDYRQTPATVGRDPRARAALLRARHRTGCARLRSRLRARTSTSTQGGATGPCRARCVVASALRGAGVHTLARRDRRAAMPGRSGRGASTALCATSRDHLGRSRLMTRARALRALARILAVPLGVAASLGLIDALRSLPGPGVALALPLRETGHDDRASVIVVVGAFAVVFGLIACALDPRPPPAARARRSCRRAAVLACALALQARLAPARAPGQLRPRLGAARSTRRRRSRARSARSAASPCAGALPSSDRRRRPGQEEHPVEGAPEAPPLAKIGA